MSEDSLPFSGTLYVSLEAFQRFQAELEREPAVNERLLEMMKRSREQFEQWGRRDLETPPPSPANS